MRGSERNRGSRRRHRLARRRCRRAVRGAARRALRRPRLRARRRAARSGRGAGRARSGVAPEVPQVTVASTLDALGRAGALAPPTLGRADRRGRRLGRQDHDQERHLSRCCSRALAGRVHAAPGNLNNRIGVPMVLLGLGARAPAGGRRDRHQSARRSAQAQPGLRARRRRAHADRLEHAEGLGDLDAIEAEEGALFAALREGGAAIANGDDVARSPQLAACTAATRSAYGTEPAADYRVRERRSRDDGRFDALDRTQCSARRRRGSTIETTLLGQAGALSSVAALAAAERSGRVPRSSRALVNRALRDRSIGEAGRLVPIELEGRVLVLDDSYNANPPSLRTSLAAARELATRARRAPGARARRDARARRVVGAGAPRARRRAARKRRGGAGRGGGRRGAVRRGRARATGSTPSSCATPTPRSSACSEWSAPATSCWSRRRAACAPNAWSRA